MNFLYVSIDDIKSIRSIIFLITFFLIAPYCDAQVRTIIGKVVDEFDFAGVPDVRIQTRDTVQLGVTDINGNFKIELPSETNELLLSSLGMSWTSIRVPVNCSKLEIIMGAGVIYDYMSLRKINKERYKWFKDLPNKHCKAYYKRIFTSKTPCFTYIFHKY